MPEPADLPRRARAAQLIGRSAECAVLDQLAGLPELEVGGLRTSDARARSIPKRIKLSPRPCSMTIRASSTREPMWSLRNIWRRWQATVWTLMYMRLAIC
jgi:hypothetical protein